MRIGSQGRLPLSADRLSYAQRSSQVRLDRQQIDKEPDQLFQVQMTASGDRCANHNPPLTAVPVQQDLELKKFKGMYTEEK